MASVYDTLSEWVRKTSSTFAELVQHADRDDEAQGGPTALIYRLRTWPDLPASNKTARLYRALSVMSHRPVNRRWFIEHSNLSPAKAERLLQRLVDEGSVEVIDPAKFAA